MQKEPNNSSFFKQKSKINFDHPPPPQIPPNPPNPPSNPLHNYYPNTIIERLFTFVMKLGSSSKNQLSRSTHNWNIETGFKFP